MISSFHLLPINWTVVATGQLTGRNPKSMYACLNYDEAFAPDEIRKRSVCISGDIGEILFQL